MIGGRVRAARLARGWTQQELARRVGLTQSSVSAIEGDLKTPRRRARERLAEALDLDLGPPATAVHRPAVRPAGLAARTSKEPDEAPPAA